MKTYVVGTQKHLAEVLLMSTYNIYFLVGIRKIFTQYLLSWSCVYFILGWGKVPAVILKIFALFFFNFIIQSC